MTTIELVYNAIKDQCPPIEKTIYPNEICAFTGKVTDCVLLSECVSDNFCGHNNLKIPSSPYASIDAYQALHYKDQRSSSWFCDGQTFEKLDRKGVRTKVFQEEMPNAWSGYATTSYKKHGVLATKLNSLNQRIWTFETKIVNCSDWQQLNDWWLTLNDFLEKNISRSIMENLDCPPYVLEKIGWTVYQAFRKWAKDKYLSNLYCFLVYLLPSQEELKERGKR